MKISLALPRALLPVILVIGSMAHGQPPASPAPTATQTPAQQNAPIDLSGYWVSVVTEDWRWRMLTPPKGDFESVPLNAAGRALAMQFNPAAYGGNWSGVVDCRAYGAAGLMRMPTRLHITWANPDQMQIKTDWGEQTRVIYFRQEDIPHAAPSPQGSSFGIWELPIGPAGGTGFGALTYRGPKLPGGDLKVVTDNLSPGWLRRNGVPYGSQTLLTEYYQTFPVPPGTTWFDVTTRVADPEYLTTPFITSSDFLKESDGSKWTPHPCKDLDHG